MTTAVAALLLAAGKSRRMGSCKQLLPLGNGTVIGRCLETLISAGLDEIVVVVSPDNAEVLVEVEKFPVQIVVNSHGDGDMASSVRVGRAALPADIRGVIVALCDYPLVQVETFEHLIRVHAEQQDRIIIPCLDGKGGHPLLFPRAVLDDLAEDQILRDLVRNNTDRICHIEVQDPGILLDMDTPEDYQRICHMLERQT